MNLSVDKLEIVFDDGVTKERISLSFSSSDHHVMLFDHVSMLPSYSLRLCIALCICLSCCKDPQVILWTHLKLMYPPTKKCNSLRKKTKKILESKWRYLLRHIRLWQNYRASKCKVIFTAYIFVYFAVFKFHFKTWLQAQSADILLI